MTERRWSRPLLLLALAGASCSSPAPEPAEQSLAHEVGTRKRRMLTATESAIHRLLGAAAAEIGAVREDYHRDLEAVPRGPLLATADEVLENYGRASRERFQEQVEALEVRTTRQLTDILDAYETRLWTVAEEAGRIEGARALHHRSGYFELDEMVVATLAQIGRIADRDEIHQAALRREYDQIRLERVLRQEVPGVGIVQMFQLAPDPHPGARTRALAPYCFCLVRAPEVMDVPLRFAQVLHHRLESDGIILVDSDWRREDAGRDGGELPLRAEIEDPRYLATDVGDPRPRTDIRGGQRLRDLRLVSEYRTALQRSDTGEVLVTVAWHIRWALDYRGQMQVLETQAGGPLLLFDDTTVQDVQQRPPEPLPWILEFADD